MRKKNQRQNADFIGLEQEVLIYNNVLQLSYQIDRKS